MVGNGAPVSDGQFGEATVSDPPAATSPRVVCDQACQDYCGGLDATLTNPVDRGLCRSLWGVGLDTQPIEPTEACRRLFVDMAGRYPMRAEAEQTCSNRPWGDVVSELMSKDEFVLINQRRWADELLYNNEAVSVERIFDMDALVAKLYRGLVSYDEFAAVVSAHPVLTRRYDTAGDRAEALFNIFLHRPPFENERADMSRLYSLWSNGYYDHPTLNMRLPDSTIRYNCVDASGVIAETTKGECTSVLWGYNQLILTPDIRAEVGDRGERSMWSGLLKPGEWQQLQVPGTVISKRVGFWEAAVDKVIEQYLGYDLAGQVPEVRQALVEHLIAHNGDIRATHYAVATSLPYLQSSVLAVPADQVINNVRWSYGPLKQVMVEPWIDSIKNSTGFDLGQCDHRISRPDQFLEASKSVAAVSMIENSRWQLTPAGGVREDYEKLARNLGGCPDNQVGGRFTAVSILATAAQENFVYRVCNPKQDPAIRGVDVARLLPAGMGADRVLDSDVAAQIADHQVGLFYSRTANAAEITEAQQAASECSSKPCSAENLARPLCFALLSSGEQLFY